MIKIGYVINNLHIGGAEVLLLNFIKNLDKKKYKVFIYTLFRQNFLKDEFVKSGATIRELGMRNNRQFWEIFQLAKLMSNDKLDIVHTHLCDADIYGRIAGRIAKINVIVSTQHSTDPWKIRKDLIRVIRSSIDRFTTRFCKVLICVSNAVATYHIKWGVPKEKIHVIYPSVSLKSSIISQVSKKKELGISPDDIIVTTVGRIAPEKNQRMLIQSAFEILKNNKNITFLIVGDGPLKQELMKYTEHSYYSKKILFLGNRRDVNELLYISDVFVLPSKHEGFPLSIIEAMQQGLPVIVSNVGGITEIVDTTTGILIHPSNRKELTEGILKLHQNRPLREYLGNNGKKKIQDKFNFANYINKTLDVYNELIITC